MNDLTHAKIGFSLLVASVATWLAAGEARSDDLAHFETPATMSGDRRSNTIAALDRVAQVSATAVGNSISITQNGNGNTAIVEADQRNSAPVSAQTVLNGSLSF